jgi:4-alpha-glucanotransferase
MASITTHDLPTIAGLWTGSDLRAQQQAGLASNGEGMGQMRERLRDFTGAADAAQPREVVALAYDLLGQAPSMVVTATLEDALAVEERPNMPSTLDEWPNWSLALPRTLEQLQQDPLPRAIAAALGRPHPTR